MLTAPSPRGAPFRGIGTIIAVRRLLEYGWTRDTPPLVRARRVLFRLLAEDDDPDYLFEFASSKAALNDDLRRRARGILREAAAATLAQAGYEGDPRLRGAARRMLERVGGYLRSPLARRPFVRAGNQHVLPAEASPPSIYHLLMLAHMPLFRSEHHEAMATLFHYLAEPAPRRSPLQRCGGAVIAQPHLILGDPVATRSAAAADPVFTVTWLELTARLGFLRQHEPWLRLLDGLLGERDRDGVWRARKGGSVPRSANDVLWPVYPLEDDTTGEQRWTDMTFRLGLIARLSGRTIEPR